MIQYKTVIKKFAAHGEKTGWTYIEISAKIAEKLLPDNKKSFRVKGKLDDFEFAGMALLPMGGGDFIMALKADVRKKIKKSKGAVLTVTLQLDSSPVKFNAELLECLADEPAALTFFNGLPAGHRKYFSNWIESAKTDGTKTKRIAQTVNALSRKQHYGQMIVAMKSEKELLKS